MKPGLQTTAFWLTLATDVATILSAIAGVLSPGQATITLALANGIYAVTRACSRASVAALPPPAAPASADQPSTINHQPSQ